MVEGYLALKMSWGGHLEMEKQSIRRYRHLQSTLTSFEGMWSREK